VQNCFLNCVLPREVAAAIGFRNDEIETEILRASSTSEFSHSLDPTRTWDPSESQKAHKSAMAHIQKLGPMVETPIVIGKMSGNSSSFLENDY
jgi:hypothetical protein